MPSKVASERREYVLDACADVAVTLLFLASEIAISLFDEHIKHPATITKLTVYAFQFGFAVAVVSHICRILWNRTFLGPWCRWLWRRMRKGGDPLDPGNGGTGPGYDGGPVPNDPSGGLQPARPDPATRSPAAPQRTVLLHPEPGDAGSRAIESASLGLLAAMFAFNYGAIGDLPRGWSTVSTGALAASVLYILATETTLVQPASALWLARNYQDAVLQLDRDVSVALRTESSNEWTVRANPFGRFRSLWFDTALFRVRWTDRLVMLVSRLGLFIIAGLVVLLNVILIVTTRR